MRSIRRLSYLASLTLVFAQSAGALEIIDAPSPYFETGIADITNLPGEFGWIDANTLLATAYGTPDNDFAVRKVVAFDLKTQAITTLVEQGSIQCVNSEKGVVSILTGTLEKIYKGNSTAAYPLSKFYSWNASQGTLLDIDKKIDGKWNHSLCLPTSKEDIQKVALPFQETDYLYLQPEHGRIGLESVNYNISDDAPRHLVLIKEGSPNKKLDVVKEKILQLPQYLKFRQAYMLSPGAFLTGGGYFKTRGGATYSEIPILLMDESGVVSRASAPAELKSHISQLAQALVLPTADGSVALIDGWPMSGGGIYAIDKKDIRRVWCSPINAQDEKAPCRIQAPVKVSPDGCKIAFFSSFLTKPIPRRLNVFSPTLKIVSVCSER